jgi:hypothetical protein
VTRSAPAVGEPSDVAANRRGEITPGQRKNLAQAASRGQTYGVGLLVGFPAFMAVMAWVVYLQEPRSLPMYGLVAVPFTLVVVLLVIVQLRRKWATGRELSEGPPIAQTEGEVLFGRGRYVATIPGRTLRPLEGSLSLVPGHYRFFHLPRTGWLLSAEKLADPVDADQALGRVLATANHFSPQSIGINRQGRLAAGQIVKLLRHGIWSVALGSVLLAVAAYAGFRFHLGDERLSVWAVIAVFGFGALGVVALNEGRQTAADILGGRVRSVEGVGRKDVDSRGGRRSSVRYFYVFNELKFFVSHRGYEALVDGRRYRLYYAPRTQVMVSIEPAEDQN